MFNSLRTFSANYWILFAFLSLVLLIGGGSRPDIVSLIVLRPIAAIVCAYALWTVTREQIAAHLQLIAVAGLTILLVLVHLIPLPPALWSLLPGREAIVRIDAAVGLDVWRPISLAPVTTWNALFSLLVPLGGLLLGIQLSVREQQALLPLLLGYSILSAMLGIAQTLGPWDSPLYFYSSTNTGFAVGLFANRNHAAVLLALAIPLWAAFSVPRTGRARQLGPRTWAAVASIAICTPLILLTGSRAGVLLAVASLLVAPLLCFPRSDRRSRISRGIAWAGGLVAVTLMGIVFVLSGRAPALDRLLTTGVGEEHRLRLITPVLEMAWRYTPFGSGIGTFIPVYQLDEPNEMLAATYANHVHNDWIEIWMTGGLPAVALAVAVAAWWLSRTRRAWVGADPALTTTLYARLGSFMFLMFGISSLFDYPLRVPSLMCVAVVALLWMNAGESGRPRRGGAKAGGNHNFPPLSAGNSVGDPS